MINSEIFIRPANENDVGFIVKSFVAERYNWTEFKFRPSDTHKTLSEKVLAEMFARGAKAYVAVLNEDTSVYVGYIIVEEFSAPVGKLRVVHFLYVKKALRRQGVAKAILDYFKIDTSKPIVTTCACPIFNKSRLRENYSFIQRIDLI